MSTSDRAEHGAEELKGKAKGGLGDALDNEQMEAEGKNEKSSAQLKQASDKVQDAAGDVKAALHARLSAQRHHDRGAGETSADAVGSPIFAIWVTESLWRALIRRR